MLELPRDENFFFLTVGAAAAAAVEFYAAFSFSSFVPISGLVVLVAVAVRRAVLRVHEGRNRGLALEVEPLHEERLDLLGGGRPAVLRGLTGGSSFDGA